MKYYWKLALPDEHSFGREFLYAQKWCKSLSLFLIREKSGLLDYVQYILLFVLVFITRF